jgi:O-acetyl-ADP-ribose deacetylase (regulator of RNase III)
VTVHFVSGDPLVIPADIRVCTVNCVGAMGAGVALAFRRRFPGLYDAYRVACFRGEIVPGRLFEWRSSDAWVVCLLTKRHWRENSRYDDIAAGLQALRAYLADRPGVRVALPALGCGNGGLDWARVRLMISQILADADAEILALEPAAARASDPRDCFVGRSGPPSSVDAWRSVSAHTGPWAAAACRALGIRSIVSGGQDGVDVGALRWAAALGLPAGGWAPRGMRSESGRVAPDVARLLRELASGDYAARTRANVRAADAVLVVAAPGTAGPGTALTLREAAAARRPALELAPDPWFAIALVAWLRSLQSAPDTVLMVAGPRASRWSAGEREVVRLLGTALASAARAFDDGAR